MRQTSLLRRRCSRRSIRRRLSVNAAGVVRQRSTLPCTTDTILQLVVLQWRVHARWSAADAVTLDSVAAPVNRRKRAILDCSRPQHTHPHLMALCPGLPGWAGTRKVKPIWILLKQETEWQWHQLGNMQVCTALQTNNHASTPPLRFLQAGCPSWRPTSSIKALKGYLVQQATRSQKNHCHFKLATAILRSRITESQP